MKSKRIRREICYVCGFEHSEEEIYNHKPIYRIKRRKYKLEIEAIKTKEEARQLAIDYQHKQSKCCMSYGEIIKHTNFFEKLAKKFNLTREFKENGII